LLKVISLIIFTFYNLGSLHSQESFSYAFITNQESNKVDVIDLKQRKKIKEISVGNKPAGIAIDSINRHVYVSNPESGNVTQIDAKNFKTQNFKSGSSPLGIFFSENKNTLVVSNWYDDQISLIKIDSQKSPDQKIVKVGTSPSGIYISNKNKEIYVANREDNNIYIIDSDELILKKKVNVGNAPFGVYSEKEVDFFIVTNVQSNSISVINKNNHDLIKTIKVEDWPYQAVYDFTKNHLYVTNQRSNSISVIDMQDYKNIRTINEICEYPEGIDISYKHKLIVVACWFEDNITLLDLETLNVLKKIQTSGGPRAFGKFILEN
jgi:YVTN family beta-propeller protein